MCGVFGVVLPPAGLQLRHGLSRDLVDGANPAEVFAQVDQLDRRTQRAAPVEDLRLRQVEGEEAAIGGGQHPLAQLLQHQLLSLAVRRPDAAERFRVLGRDRLLDPGGPEGLQVTGQPDRLRLADNRRNRFTPIPGFVMSKNRLVGKARLVQHLGPRLGRRGERLSENIAVIEDLCNTMKFGSLCALGGFTPYPVMSALKHFREDFGPAPATLQAAE